MVKQREIAEKLNLSVMTVSKALRNHADLSEATRNLVIQKAIEMGYAKIPALVTTTKRIGIIGYQVPSETQPFFDTEIRRKIFDAIQRECRKNQIEIVIESPRPDETPLLIKNGTVKAVLLMGRYTRESLALLQNTPTLAVSSFLSSSLIPRIVADNVEGIRQTTEHLISLGHKNILFVGFNENDLTDMYRERCNGYVIATQSHGLKSNIKFVSRDFQTDDLNEICQYRAIVCSSDSLGQSLIHQLRLRGENLKDYSITGFDNIRFFQASEAQMLTTYAPDWDLMGEVAVHTLLNPSRHFLSNGITITIPGKLIIRESTSRI